MGKTKTAFVGDEETKQKERTPKKPVEKTEKIHVSGLKGGQRVVTVDAGPEVSTEPQVTSETKKKKIPRVRGKKYIQAKAKVDVTKLYKLDEAIKLAKDTSLTKFDPTIELHLVTKKDGISVNLALPFAAGKAKKIAFANDEVIASLKEGKIDFDVLLATADYMPKLVPFARILGPKGLMPNPKNGTLVKSEKDVSKFSANTINIKTEKTAPLIHTVLGKGSQKDSELADNAKAIFKSVGEKLIKKAFVKASMGPSVKVSLS